MLKQCGDFFSLAAFLTLGQAKDLRFKMQKAPKTLDIGVTLDKTALLFLKKTTQVSEMTSAFANKDKNSTRCTGVLHQMKFKRKC